MKASFFAAILSILCMAFVMEVAVADTGPPGISVIDHYDNVFLQAEVPATLILAVPEFSVEMGSALNVPNYQADVALDHKSEDPISWRLRTYQDSYGENSGYKRILNRNCRSNC